MWLACDCLPSMVRALFPQGNETNGSNGGAWERTRTAHLPHAFPSHSFWFEKLCTKYANNDKILSFYSSFTVF